jgi:Zn-dependent alcohol dehydrogenase
MPQLNYFSRPAMFFGENKEPYGGSYFGQSSFSSLSACKESSVVNVSGIIKNEEELKMFSPLGCGFQTGSGAVYNIAQAGKKDTIVVMGLGGVGLAAIMTANVQGCAIIIGIDRFENRLEFAKTLGATHVINTSGNDLNLVEKIRSITDGMGPSITIDTTGNMGLIKSGVEFTANNGQFIFIGIPPTDAELSVHMTTLIQVWPPVRQGRVILLTLNRVGRTSAVV